MTISTLVSISRSMAWYVAIWVTGGAICIILLLVYGLSGVVFALILNSGFLWYGSEYRGWGTAISMGGKVAKSFSYARLLWSVLTLHAPIQDEADIASNPVRYSYNLRRSKINF